MLSSRQPFRKQTTAKNLILIVGKCWHKIELVSKIIELKKFEYLTLATV